MLSDAVIVMAEHDIGSLVVMERGRLAGMLTFREVIRVLARRQQPAMPASITTPAALRLKVEPTADCGRYDSIRKVA
jgi:CBS domain-containing protein